MDTIGNLIITIKNGYARGKREVVAPHSRMSERICDILVQKGFLKEVKIIKDERGFKALSISLKYSEKIPALSNIRRVSKLGRRVYRGFADIPKIRFGYGVTILSTPKGVFPADEARKNHLGGEIICQAW